MKDKMKKVLVVFVGIIMMLSLFGCGATEYKVDYNGSKELYKGAKDSYKAGAKVRLVYELFATDTSYSFYVDGKSINYSYDDNEGFIIEFEMPEHDITVECEMRNDMMYQPDSEQ